MTAAMMTCKELVELVTQYLEKALSAEDHARFEAHLAACPGCMEYLTEFRETIHLTGRLSEEHIPASTRRRLLHTFRELNQR